MGAKASKPAQSATRKFPTRAPGSAVPPPPPRAPPATASRPQASFTKDDVITADGMDPHSIPDPNPNQDAAFSSRLRQMGVATPNPTLSNSSTARPFAQQPGPGRPPHPNSSPDPSYPAAPGNNATLGTLEARRRLQERAQAEAEVPGSAREFLDVGTLRQVLNLRARGTPAGEIEARLRLKGGVVARLGKPGIVVPLNGA
ncbi:hypothetical protein DL764_004784 [Monosporascus ibericus]|uniref:Helix-turn-helix domain-containing protein n=1 Tax=Monosporascus ibericus TaxID=155417 RepID=A0A4Q4TEM4_9PEZI|nr:hypothetical protein DL764_004784 [Monosporascus ibericus]